MNIDESTISFEQEAEKLELLGFKYETREDLLIGVRAFYSAKGYALSICSSKSEKYVVLQCDRGGQYRDVRGVPLDEREKTTGTRRINCPFKIKGKKTDEGIWIIEVRNLSHNHEASADISGHPSLRQLSQEDIEKVDHMTRSGIPPRQILSSLRQKNPELKAVSKTVYNVKAKIHREKLEGRTMIQALLEELGGGGFEYDILQDEGDFLTHLFFIHPMSITLVKNFPSVFIMDCTYKTNKYKMPLFDIVGVSCFNTSFYAGCAFLKNEREEDFIWALSMFKKVLPKETQPSVIMSDRQQAFTNAVNVVFPATIHLLCVWHIEKNLMTNCRKHFDSKEEYDIFLSIWNKVVYSSTEAEFDQNWLELQSLYKEKKASLQYIMKDLLPLKEKFIGAWTNKYLHLGNRASSRAEGAHAKLKMYLQVSTGDFQRVKDKISLAVENEFNEIKVNLSREKICILHSCDIPLFKKLLMNISIYALKELYKQYEKIKNRTFNPVCTGNFEATMGLPCAHKIMKFTNSMLPLDLIHPQWRIDDRSLLYAPPPNSTNDVDTEMMSLFTEFQSKYQEWPLHKKEAAKELISNFMSNSELILEPKVPRNRRKLWRPKKQKTLSSTKRDPSKFELVEASKKHKSCNNNEAPVANEAADENEDLNMIFENNVTTMLNLNEFPSF